MALAWGQTKVNRAQDSAAELCARSIWFSAPRISSHSLPLTTTSTAHTMSAAVHPLTNHLMPHYPRQSLNGVNHNPPGPSVMAHSSPVTTRKRKRAHQYTVSYSEVQEVDSDGHLREVIVIEDTPPPPTLSPATTNNGGYSASYQPPAYSGPIRTRAAARAEAQALSSSSSSTTTAPAPKKRKRDHQEEVRAPVKKLVTTSSQQTVAVAPANSWESRSAAATEDVRLLASPSGQ